MNQRRNLFFSLILVLLIFFQLYQTLFHSWVAEYSDSQRAALLSENLHSLPKEKTVFFFNVPEAVSFLPHNNYFQYFRFANTVQGGQDNLPLLWEGTPDFLIVDQKFEDGNRISNFYQEKSHFDKYVLFEKIK